MALTSASDQRTAHVTAVELDSERERARYADLMDMRTYWNAKRQDRFAPKRADIEPADLKELLPRIMLADVFSDGPLDFRYRLSGTGVNTILGGEYTGKRPRDLAPLAYGAMVHDHYCSAVRRREPLFHVIMLDSFERLVTYTRLLLPLSEDGETVTMLMAAHSKKEDSRALQEFFVKVGRLS